MIKKIARKLLARLAQMPQPSAPVVEGGLEERIRHLEQVVFYLENQQKWMATIIRRLAAPVIHDLMQSSQTKESFNFQWGRVPLGRWSLDNPEFRKEAPGNVVEFTGLPKEWFKGKKAVDVGCGAGRYSWGMLTLGAEVLSLDQSDYGLQKAKEACSAFPGHRTMKVDLLKPLPIDEKFDLVWSFGVLHHTGDTYGAFKNVVPLVKPGGRIFLMIYGEPRAGITDDYSAVNEYDIWRDKTRNMSLDEKLDAVMSAMRAGEFRAQSEEYIEGYFDAISPNINDLYGYSELEGWLKAEGFVNIERTVPNRNIFIAAWKKQ